MVPHIYFPFMGSSQASEGKASPRLRHSQTPWSWSTLVHLPLVLPNVASEVSRSKLQMQQPSFPKWGFARGKRQGPWCLPPPADGWGLRIGVFSRKFCESSAKEWAKVKVHFEGSGPEKPCKKLPNQQQLDLRRGFRDASAACLQGYEEVIRWLSG